MLEASAYASDALGKCRLAVWAGEGETRVQARQRRGFSRDASLERVRAEPAGALMGVSTCMLGVYWGNAAWLRGSGRAKRVAQTRQPRGFSRDESLERERAEPAVTPAGWDALGRNALRP